LANLKHTAQCQLIFANPVRLHRHLARIIPADVHGDPQLTHRLANHHLELGLDQGVVDAASGVIDRQLLGKDGRDQQGDEDGDLRSPRRYAA
jgi:hypothetical protein